MSSRVLLLLPTTSYKAEDFLDAAERLGIEVVVGTDRRQALESVMPGTTMQFDFVHPERSLAEVAALHAGAPFRAVIGVDDETTEFAARAAAALALPHNDPRAVQATRDKFVMRTRLAAGGLAGPSFRRVALDADPSGVAAEVDYPCVLKPLHLSASRGVLRADDPAQFERAFATIGAILQSRDVRARSGDAAHLLVEDYLDGEEVAVEALLDRGALHTLALFDKPDPLEGPTFEETIYVTPSRKPQAAQSAILDEVAAACRALGLSHGPVHAELRWSAIGPRIIEVAARTIGGLCSRTLRYGSGVSLEQLVLRHALGQLAEVLRSPPRPAGVMMLPIVRRGVLREVRGLERARAIPGIEEITLTLHRGAPLEPLPEGHAYLGFIFATGADPQEVERRLRRAHGCLEVVLEPGPATS